MTMNQEEILYLFGEKLIKSARDKTISESFKTLKGQIKDESSKRIAKELSNLSSSQEESVRDLIIDSIDGALNNFFWMIEQEEKLDLVACQNQNIISLKEVSDGLSVDYWNFVDDFSHYKKVE